MLRFLLCAFCCVLFVQRAAAADVPFSVKLDCARSNALMHALELRANGKVPSPSACPPVPKVGLKKRNTVFSTNDFEESVFIDRNKNRYRFRVYKKTLRREVKKDD